MDHPAVHHLKRTDPVLGALIDQVGVLPPGPRTDGSHLAHIARAIVYQQLSGQAAGTIHRRFEALYGGRAPTPAELLATSDEQLRSVGLSRAKAVYLKDLAARAVDGTLPVDRLHELEDEPLIETLTSVKGIGRWTAQMFLLFRLGRPNVLPDLDLGVRKGIQKTYNLRRLPTPEEVRVRGAAWAPYSSIAAWYLWRSLELPGAKDGIRRKRSAVRATTRSPSRRPPSLPAKSRSKAGAKGKAKRVAGSTTRGAARPVKRGSKMTPTGGGRRRKSTPRAARLRATSQAGSRSSRPGGG